MASDTDFADRRHFRVVQFTPPGSPASILFGKGTTTLTPGSVDGLYLSSTTSTPPATS